ncbi:MAG: ABC transporter permease subunit [Actinobacteria bacterium]|nr:ABC transporter permease subunit [Actinomycetota bacterium]
MAVAAASRPAAWPARIIRSRRTARFLFPLVVLAVWQLAFMFLETAVLPSPGKVLSFMWDEVRMDTLSRHTLYQSFAISLGRLIVGFLIALAIGLVIGLLMGLVRPIEYFLYDVVVVVLAVPSLVWALITGLLFGLGNNAPIVTVIGVGIPFVILNVLEGVKNSPKELFDMSRAFRVPRRRVVRHVLLPSLMPFFFAALRYGFANGWKGLVLAEVFASTNGAGWTIRYWYDAHRAQGVLGYALFFVLFALILERGVFERVSRYVFRWRPQAQLEVVEEAVPEAKLKVATVEAERMAADRGTG